MSKGSAGAVFGLRLLWKVCHQEALGQIQQHTRQAHNDMMQFTGKQREEANFKALMWKTIRSRNGHLMITLKILMNEI